MNSTGAAWSHLRPEQQAGYTMQIGQGLRRGQAWFNVLDIEDKSALIDSGFDPFYSDKTDDVVKAYDHLMTMKTEGEVA